MTTTPLAERDRPTPEELAEVARRLPTDPASQAAIDLRYSRRDRPGWTPISVRDLTDSLTKFLGSRIEGPFTVRDARWLTGGASKIQMQFTLDWTDPERGAVSDHLLVRMDPPETLNTTNKETEFEIVRAVTGPLPAPAAMWADPRGDELPEPALIYALVSGVTKPSASGEGAVSGLGTGFGPELRARLAPQFVQHLAAMHLVDAASLASPAVIVPRIGTTEAAQARLNFERAVWELDRGQDVPLMEVAAGWMQGNLPVTDRVGVVHGDYRSGNFLFDEQTSQITAWLDWELGHVGDRHEDLAYCTHPLFGSPDENGTFLASGMMPPADLYAAYERVSGLSVDPARLEWFGMLITFSAIVRTFATPYRVARLGRSHQDILLTRLEGVVPLLMGQLIVHLEKVM